jgi:HEAT repeat protein
LTATDAGRALLAEGQARRIAPLVAALSTLPDDRRAALAEGLAVLERLLAETIPSRAS